MSFSYISYVPSRCAAKYEFGYLELYTAIKVLKQTPNHDKPERKSYGKPEEPIVPQEVEESSVPPKEPEPTVPQEIEKPTVLQEDFETTTTNGTFEEKVNSDGNFLKSEIFLYGGGVLIILMLIVLIFIGWCCYKKRRNNSTCESTYSSQFIHIANPVLQNRNSIGYSVDYHTDEDADTDRPLNSYCSLNFSKPSSKFVYVLNIVTYVVVFQILFKII